MKAKARSLVFSLKLHFTLRERDQRKPTRIRRSCMLFSKQKKIPQRHNY